MDYEDRMGLTFGQAEGIEALPSQLELGEISEELQALLWDYLLRILEENSQSQMYGYALTERFKALWRDYNVRQLHRPRDEVTVEPQKVGNEIKRIVYEGSYVQIFNFLQYVMGHQNAPSYFARRIGRIFEQSRAAYRVYNERIIVPIASPEEGEAVELAFQNLQASEFGGARAHLSAAAEAATAGRWSDSIRESVHAVEAVVRTLEPGAKLPEALRKLEAKRAMHPALKDAFSKLYGWTNDEKGIRHPLLEKATAAVDEVDAIYMLGACAAFVSYLIRRGEALE